MGTTGYTKLFSSILMSSIWEEPEPTRIVWITMLALADQHGHVDGTVKSLARVARVPIDGAETALATFLAPDPCDRSGVDDGRRIRSESGGWSIVNHAAYRNKMTQDERRERDRLRKRVERLKKPRMSAPRPQSSEFVHEIPHQIRSDQIIEKEKSMSLAPVSEPLATRSDPFLDASITARAGAFVERYEALYQQHRKARYLVRPTRDYAAAVPLCATWTDDARLDKLAAIFLTTDHQFAESGSRTIPQFAALASWADSKLAEWEAQQGPA